MTSGFSDPSRLSCAPSRQSVFAVGQILPAARRSRIAAPWPFSLRQADHDGAGLGLKALHDLGVAGVKGSDVLPEPQSDQVLDGLV
jgi:hypothetical protein